MRKRRMAKRSISRPAGVLKWAALPVCLCLIVGGGEAQEPSGLDVGRISDLDLNALRSIIDEQGGIEEPGTVGLRSLSLEAAVKTALEENLGLQIIAVDVASSERQIDVSESKFHPVAAVGGEATGTRRNESNPALQDQTSDRQEAQVVLRQQVPTGGDVSFGIGYAREFRNEVVTDSGNNNFNQTNLNEIAGLGIEISQPLLRGGRTYVARQQILDARYDTEVRRAELKSEVLRVTAETKAAYYQVIGAHRQIEVVEQALVRDGELIRASSALFDAGRVSKVDLFSAEISQSNDRARLATAQANLEVAQNSLRKVIGLPVNIEVEITDTTIPFWPIRMDLQGWTERAIDMRPELLALQSERAKIDLAVKVRKNEKLPGLDVKGGFFPGFDWKSYNYNAGLSFDYPLGNAAAKGRLDQARLAQDKIRHEIARAKRDIELEVREIEIRLRENLARVENLTAAVTSAREKREIARGRFEMGLANNLDITNADQELVRAETLLLEALVDYATNIAFLESRIGGEL